MDLLNVIYVLIGFGVVMLCISIADEYFYEKKLKKEILDSIKLVHEKDVVQGIKKRAVKPKTTTDMIKVNGKTKVVKRDKKGHFVK